MLIFTEKESQSTYERRGSGLEWRLYVVLIDRELCNDLDSANGNEHLLGPLSGQTPDLPVLGIQEQQIGRLGLISDT
jgi:hypothetical protein